MPPGIRSVLVTGATGFVGSAVVRALLAAGHEVIGLCRSEHAARELAGCGAKVARGDMTDPAGCASLVGDVDAVVHAAQLRVTGRFGRAEMRRVNQANALMTGALAQSCLAEGKRLIYTGGCFIYGDHGSEWINERTPLTPSPVGAGDAEQIRRLREYHRNGLDVVVISPGFVYGPGGTFKTGFYDQFRRRRLRCLGAGDNYWSCVHVDDLATAYALALVHAPAGAEYNVVDDAPLMLRSLLDQLADAMAAPRVGSLPVPVGALILGRPLVASLTTSYRVDNAKARTELGWSPAFPTVGEGLPPTLTTLLKNET